MVLNKRIVKGVNEHTDFEFVSKLSEKADVLQAMRHQTLAGILGQLASLFAHAHDLYNDLHQELSADTQRIASLATRAQAAFAVIPQVEEHCRTA